MTDPDIIKMANRFRCARHAANEPVALNNIEFQQLCQRHDLTQRLSQRYLLNGFYRIDAKKPWMLGNIGFDETRMIKKPYPRKSRLTSMTPEIMATRMQKQSAEGIEILTVRQWVQRLSVSE